MRILKLPKISDTARNYCRRTGEYTNLAIRLFSSTVYLIFVINISLAETFSEDQRYYAWRYGIRTVCVFGLSQPRFTRVMVLHTCSILADCGVYGVRGRSFTPVFCLHEVISELLNSETSSVTGNRDQLARWRGHSSMTACYSLVR